MTTKLIFYILVGFLPLLGCGYTVLKEDEASSTDIEPPAKNVLEHHLEFELKEYETLIASGSSRDEALHIFNNHGILDAHGRLLVTISLFFFNHAVEDTIEAYGGKIRFEVRTTPVSISCNIPPEAIRPISFMKYVERIRRPSPMISR